jgi:hypothetical protein
LPYSRSILWNRLPFDELHLDLFLLHVREIRFDDELPVGLLDVDRRHEVGEPFARGPRRPIEEQAVQPLLQVVHLDEWVPTCELHNASLPAAGSPRAAAGFRRRGTVAGGGDPNESSRRR